MESLSKLRGNTYAYLCEVSSKLRDNTYARLSVGKRRVNILGYGSQGSN